MIHGLSEDTVQKLLDVFASFPQVDEAILYGSRAKGNYGPGSDIDITLKGKELDLSIMNEISLKVDDLLLPYIVDLSIYDQIDNPELVNHIQRIGVCVYKRAKS